MLPLSPRRRASRALEQDSDADECSPSKRRQLPDVRLVALNAREGHLGISFRNNNGAGGGVIVHTVRLCMAHGHTRLHTIPTVSYTHLTLPTICSV
eukprot:3138511-Prymnesium_polylepis.1